MARDTFTERKIENTEVHEKINFPEDGGGRRRTARERQRIRISITIDSCIIKKGDVNLKPFFYLTNNASPTLSHLLRPLFLPFPSVPSPPSLPPSFFNLTPFPRMEFETEKDIFKKYRILFSLNKLRRDINFTGGRPR